LISAVAVFVATIAISVGTSARPVAAADGMRVTSTTTYTVDPTAGIVRANVNFEFLNQVPDRRDGNIIQRAYFSGFSTALPIGSANVVAATANGTALSLETEFFEDNENFYGASIDFPRNLFYGQSLDVVLTYDINGFLPRAENPSRVNNAYAAFEAYGIGDSGRVTVRVVVPSGFVVDTFGDDVEVTTEGDNTIYTATEIEQPDEFFVFITARNDTALDSRLVELDGGATFDVRAWPGDEEWANFVTDQIETGVPALEQAIGQPWPIAESVEVRETYTLYFYGYAGVFMGDTNEIELGEDLDAETALHELSHAWFNSDTYEGRWISEGLAQVYSNAVLADQGGTPTEAFVPSVNAAGQQPLNSWVSTWFDDDTDDDAQDDEEDHGYQTSHWVMQSIVDEVGIDGMRAVMAAIAADELAYLGDLPAEEDPYLVDWQRLLDLLEERAGSTAADEMYRQFVVTPAEVAVLDDRGEARELYAALVDAGAGWAAPVDVRKAMARWQFDRATSLIGESRDVLERRDELDALVDELGVDYVDSIEADYEATVGSFDSVTEALDDHIDAATALQAAIDAEGQDPGFVDGLGLIGTSLPDNLDAAKAAFEAGDLDEVGRQVDIVETTLDEASSVGSRRLWTTIAAVVGTLALIGLLWWLLRHRKRRRRMAVERQAATAESSGGVDGIELDEDALAGAGEGGIDNGLVVALAHKGEAAGTTGIVQGDAVLGNVGNAVLKLDEHVGAVVEAQPIAGAQVLVDPHPHDSAEAIAAAVQSPDAATVSHGPMNDVAPTFDQLRAPHAEQRAHRWERPTGDVDDPWAWLRDRDDAATVAYLRAENAYADAWFAEHQPVVTTIFEEIKSRVQETDESVPVQHGPWWYVSRTEEAKSYAIHCRGRTRDTATEHTLLDENIEAADHDYFAVNVFDVSPDHNLLAYSTDTDGAERYTMRFRDVSSGLDLADTIPNTAWGASAWAADNSHIFYVTADDQMRPFQVWRHHIGTPTSDDTLVFHENDERFFVGVSLTRSSRWIVIESRSKTSAEALLVPADEPLAAPQVVRTRADNVEYSIDDWDDRFVVLTNEGALDFQVCSAPTDAPAQWSTLVEHVPGRRIVDVEPFAAHLVIHEWSDAQPRVRVLSRAAAAVGEQPRTIDFGDEPHDLELDSNPEWTATTLRVTYQSFTTPSSVIEIDLTTDARTVLKRTPVNNCDLTRYVAHREWATAYDGTRIAVDIVRHVDTANDGSAPCVIYGYGSYEISLAPWFSVARLSLLDRGAVWALVHPRGGGEGGRQWYLDGRLTSKRNTFTDTLACADHLVQLGWAAADRRCLRGGSAGGLLVGACLHLAPQTFRAAIAEVPFVDVVTTMSDPTLPLTVTEWEEWGDPRAEPFASYILSYSPYDNAVLADQLALYVTAGLNDPRVSYHEPAKWVAKLRHLRNTAPQSASPPPVLFHCEMGAGHGGPSGRYDAWREEARILTFTLAALDVADS
jgi:oligopeptidase B